MTHIDEQKNNFCDGLKLKLVITFHQKFVVKMKWT